MRTLPKTWTATIIGLALLATLFVFLSPQSHDVVAADRSTPKPVVKRTVDVEPTEIVPSDVLTPADMRWFPRTGDGSN